MEKSSTMDLHIHSTFSDGVLKPSELVDMAKTDGLSAISITDHDTAAGTDEAIQRGRQQGIEVIPGIEISSWYNSTSMHILGYWIQHDDREFRNRLQELQDGRHIRNVKIIENLNRMGITATIDELTKYSEYGQTGRPHIARLLVDKGLVKSVEQAFRHYLGKGKAAYADRFKFAAHDAIAMIREAGGIAESVVREGDDTAGDIIALSTELGTEAIVIGSHGKGGFQGLLGSTGAKLVRRAKCPVLVVR
jgi:predicted metal-dependent phosphoesterase TrpH